MANRPKLAKEDNCIYLLQDISGLNIYDRAKAIVNFVDKETKELEKEIDKAILDIFERNGINIPNNKKSVLKRAFDLLKGKGKDIVVKDIYADVGDLYVSELIKQTDLFTIWLEDDTYLQCAISVEEIDL